MHGENTPNRNAWNDVASHLLRLSGVIASQGTHRNQFQCAWHRHIGIEILYCHQGEGLLFLDKKRIPYGPGDLLAFDAQTPHRVEVKGTYTRSILCYWPPFFTKHSRATIEIPELATVYPGPGEDYSLTVPAADAASFTHLFTAIGNEISTRRTGYHTIVNLRVAEFFMLIGRLKQEQALKGMTAETNTEHDPMADLLVYIEENLANWLTVSNVAKRFHFSTSHLYRLFVERTGRSPSMYILGRRIRKAKSLLANSTLAVHEIATATGFANAAHFSRVFRNETGDTPTQFRQDALRVQRGISASG